MYIQCDCFARLVISEAHDRLYRKKMEIKNKNGEETAVAFLHCN